MGPKIINRNVATPHVYVQRQTISWRGLIVRTSLSCSFSSDKPAWRKKFYKLPQDLQDQSCPADSSFKEAVGKSRLMFFFFVSAFPTQTWTQNWTMNKWEERAVVHKTSWVHRWKKLKVGQTQMHFFQRTEVIIICWRSWTNSTVKPPQSLADHKVY